MRFPWVKSNLSLRVTGIVAIFLCPFLGALHIFARNKFLSYMKHVFMTNRFNVFKYLLCFVMLAIMMPSCSDDDHPEPEDPENPTELPILGSLQKDVVVGLL